MPFHDQRARDIYEAVRAVLEDAPYFWRVVRADDSVETPGLWSNLKEKLLRAHCYIAILTEKINSNVMIEIGRMEAVGRPLLFLRDSAAQDLPADRHGLLYEMLTATGPDLLEELKGAVRRQDAFQALNARDRYLSETVLTNAGLPEWVSKAICGLSSYPTWQSFLTASPQTVATLVYYRANMISAAMETLSELLEPEA
jgi:hypothetical protein